MQMLFEEEGTSETDSYSEFNECNCNNKECANCGTFIGKQNFAVVSVTKSGKNDEETNYFKKDPEKTGFRNRNVSVSAGKPRVEIEMTENTEEMQMASEILNQIDNELKISRDINSLYSLIPIKK
ncbi:hypothetical protein MHBO_001674 [Bonamia ostreae]|uniref:Uncharacterized protein n=1 Tax=Bonamia ostreae TaxID=126728 RepID=A0ABV2AJS8_9EUKA